jgi:glycosyltransferase involved in cell wall biosynthesis
MSERELPSVSAVIATRDRPAALRRAIAGVLTQDYDGVVECVVVFDGADPMDLSDAAPPPNGHRSLTVVRNTRTPGLAGARNSGVDAGFGDLVAFCDDDDEWLPGKLVAQVDVLQRSTSPVAVTGIRVVYADRETDRIPPEAVTLDLLLHTRVTQVHPSSVEVEREAFVDAIGPVDEAIPGSYGEDYEWLLRAAALGPIAAVQRPLVAVQWGGSLFADRWQTIIDAIAYLTDKHPDLLADRANAARLFGRVAFAHAALGHRGDAVRWAWRGWRRRPLERRPYLALAVAAGLVRASTIQHRANRAGRGV